MTACPLTWSDAPMAISPFSASSSCRRAEVARRPWPGAPRLRARALLPRDEDALRHHAVHALPDVHDLAHAAIRYHRRERVGLVPAERHELLGREEVHRLAHRVDHRLVQVLVEAGH